MESMEYFHLVESNLVELNLVEFNLVESIEYFPAQKTFLVSNSDFLI